MSEDALIIILLLGRLALLFAFPFLLGKGLWQLGVRFKVTKFSQLYNSLLYISSSGLALWYLVKLLIYV